MAWVFSFHNNDDVDVLSCYIQDGNMFEVKAKDKALAITSL